MQIVKDVVWATRSKSVRHQKVPPRFHEPPVCGNLSRFAPVFTAAEDRKRRETTEWLQFTGRDEKDTGDVWHGVRTVLTIEPLNCDVRVYRRGSRNITVGTPLQLCVGLQAGPNWNRYLVPWHVFLSLHRTFHFKNRPDFFCLAASWF
jgi:hypothetical protein